MGVEEGGQQCRGQGYKSSTGIMMYRVYRMNITGLQGIEVVQESTGTVVVQRYSSISAVMGYRCTRGVGD